MLLSFCYLLLLGSLCESSQKTEVFLFVGVIASNRQANGKSLRDLHREAVEPFKTKSVTLRFFLSHADRRNVTEADVVYTEFSGRYEDLCNQTRLVFVYVAQHVKCRFFLKVDDDVAVFYPWMLSRLNSLTAKCPSCHYYAGHELKRHSNRGRKYFDANWANLTANNDFVPYMTGGGYVLSSSIVQVIKLQDELTGLYCGHLEDATVGAWVIGLNITRVDWTQHWCGMAVAYRQNCTFWHSSQNLDTFKYALTNMTVVI
jgi:hypothetical protein